MKITFWGVRGSVGSGITKSDVEKKIRRTLELASPADILSPESIDRFMATLPFSLTGTYGGNTTCVEIRTDEDKLVIVDAGTGLRRLGMLLMQEARWRGQGEMTFFFTHSHWDHIQGLMFFPPILIPGNKVKIVSCFKDIEERLKYQQVRTHFPITFDEMAAEKTFDHFEEGQWYETDGLKVTSKMVKHPGGCYSYKFVQPDGKAFIFCSDAEFNMESMYNIEPYIEYFQEADILVFDTQYTFEESLQKIDWGHSSASIATDIAIKSNVKKLILFHHDPSYDDDKMDAVTMQALKYKDMMAPNHPLEIQTAFEGLTLTL
ncbi:MAG: MBL fold metallo-hydrolase [Candidatus Hydrogenedentota bacterium]|nr:MAG: MBL fold metallo-hydrolase [Candidatus Hydrogenedentota bacterium]